MTILLYKDGRLVIDDGNPIEGNSLEGLVACVSDPQIGDTLKFDGKQWVAGTAASGLPAVSGDDNGKVLTVVEGEWAPAAGGGGSDVMHVTINSIGGSQYQMTATAGEIMEAFYAGTAIVCQWDDGGYQYTRVLEVRASQNDEHEAIDINVRVADGGSIISFYSETANGYPTISFG